MKKGFTLLELVVVIVILGILATLGFSQYTRLVENERNAEAIANFSKMRELAAAYYLQNGTFSTVTEADLGMGSPGGADIPDACDSTHYFSYGFGLLNNPPPTCIGLTATRCTSGGKSPQGSWTTRGTLWLVFSGTGPPCQSEKQTCNGGGNCVIGWNIQ